MSSAIKNKTLIGIFTQNTTNNPVTKVSRARLTSPLFSSYFPSFTSFSSSSHFYRSRHLPTRQTRDVCKDDTLDLTTGVVMVVESGGEDDAARGGSRTVGLINLRALGKRRVFHQRLCNNV